MNQTTMTAVGNLITPVNLRTTVDGTPVAHFRIACNERRLDRSTGAWVDRDTFYVSVTCWRALAENVHTSFRIGDPIVVRGRIFSRSYEKDGRRNTVNEIEADVVGPDLGRATAVITRRSRRAAGSAADLVSAALHAAATPGGESVGQVRDSAEDEAFAVDTFGAQPDCPSEPWPGEERELATAGAGEDSGSR